MSNNNGSAFGKLSRFFSSNSSLNSVSDTNDELSSVSSNQEISKNVYIPSCNSTSDYSPATKRSYSSVKQLNLSPQFTPKCDQDVLINNLSTNKRLRVEENGSSSSNLSTYGGMNQFTSMQRPLSRLSLSTTSSTSTTPGFRSLKYLSGRLSSASEQTKATKDLNSSFTNDLDQPNSYFYLGKTTFGGANLHKKVRRLSATPYSTLAVRSIEAKSVNHKSRSLDDDIRLGSITQRILERLEKAATPIQDAKRRPVSNNTQTQVPSRIFSKSFKLFDTSSPAVESQGRCKVDLSYKPVKYVLKPIGESDNGGVASSLVEKDIETLNEIREAERDLGNKTNPQVNSLNFQPRKDITLGKLTFRDVKKGRRIDDLPVIEEQEHFQSLSNVKPLSLPTLKPFVLKTTIELTESKDESCDVEKKSYSGDNSNVVDKIPFNFPSPTTVASVKSTTKSSISDFSFSSPKIATISVSDGTWDEKFKSKGKDWSLAKSSDDNNSSSSTIDKTTSLNVTSDLPLNMLIKKKSFNTWTCPVCSLDNEENDDKCPSCEEPNPNKTVNAQTAAKVDFKFGNFDNSTKTLKEIFKKDIGKNWSCPTCSTSNDIGEPKCVSCEEPNPNLNPKQEKVKIPEIKFGAFASTNKIESDKHQASTTEISSIDNSEPGWNCFYCKSLNSCSSQNVCKNCNKIKVVAATKDQVQKFYDSQSFKFGFNKPISVASKTTTETSPSTTASFNFGVPKLATDVSKPQDVSSPFTVDSVSTASNKTIDKKFELPKPVDSFESTVTFKPDELKSSSSLFQFGATTTSSDSANANFKSVFPTTTQSVSSQNTSGSAASATFSFGSKGTKDDLVLKPTTSAESDKNPSMSASGNIVPTFSFGKISSVPVTSAIETSNNLFVFGAKSTENDKKSVELNVPKLSFTATTSASSTDINAISSSQTIEKNDSNRQLGIFTFGASKNVIPTTASTLPISNSSTPAFTFGDASKVSNLDGTSKSSLLGTSDLNFGSPIQMPKINAGPPVQVNPNISINFASSNASTSTTGSLFTSTQNVSSGPAFGIQSSDKPTEFNFSNASSATGSSVFGSTTIPPSFNFMSNNISSSAPNTNSLFTFGAKPNSQPASSQGSIQFNTTPAESSGFPFASSNLSQNSFGTSLFGGNTAPQGQPTQTLVVPAGLSTFPNTVPSSNVFVPNLNFQSSFVSGDNSKPESANLFQFSAEQPQFGMGGGLAERKIKKARRRLK